MEDLTPAKTKQISLNFKNEQLLYRKIMKFSNKLTDKFNRPVSATEAAFLLIKQAMDMVEATEGRLIDDTQE